jgi:ribosomal protein S18 acetylase RimI-like enzyme
MEVVDYERGHPDAIVALCRDEGWPSFPEDPERAHRVLTAPGVTSVVALDNATVVGFAYLQSDGEIQAHLSDIVVAPSHRRTGVARALLQGGIERAGGVRIDLITETAMPFYQSLSHKRWNGYRIYPPFT